MFPAVRYAEMNRSLNLSITFRYLCDVKHNEEFVFHECFDPNLILIVLFLPKRLMLPVTASGVLDS